MNSVIYDQASKAGMYGYRIPNPFRLNEYAL